MDDKQAFLHYCNILPYANFHNINKSHTHTYLLIECFQSPPPLRAHPRHKRQVFSRKRYSPVQQQYRTVSSGSVPHQNPPPLQTQQSHGPYPAQHGETAVHNHVPRQLSAPSDSKHHPAQSQQDEQHRQAHLEPIESRARDELGLHECAVTAVAYAQKRAEEEGEGEEDGWHQGEVEAKSQTALHPDLLHGDPRFTVTLHLHHDDDGGPAQRISGKNNMVRKPDQLLFPTTQTISMVLYGFHIHKLLCLLQGIYYKVQLIPQ